MLDKSEIFWKGNEAQAIIGSQKLVTSEKPYKLVWYDDFEGDSVDLSKWSGNGSGCGDASMVCTDRKGYWDVADSVGTITMTKSKEPDENGKQILNGYSFVTTNTMNFQYGFLEMRAKVPFFGKGEFPAFWLLSSQAQLARRKPDYKAKPFRIEVDIFENFSSTGRVVPNLHKYENKEGGLHCQLSGIDQGASVSGTRAYTFPEGIDPNDWHNYGMLWTDKFMSFSVDGKFYYTYDLSEDFGDISGMSGFHQPVGIIISNQVFSERYCNDNPWGKKYGPASDEIFPLKYRVDYVRLYQREDIGELLLGNEEDFKTVFNPGDGRLY